MSLIGKKMLCPCCQYRDPLGDPSAVIRMAKSRALYMTCSACGVKLWGNRPEHLAAAVAWSSLLTDSPEISEALRQRIAAVFREVTNAPAPAPAPGKVNAEEVT